MFRNILVEFCTVPPYRGVPIVQKTPSFILWCTLEAAIGWRRPISNDRNEKEQEARLSLR